LWFINRLLSGFALKIHLSHFAMLRHEHIVLLAKIVKRLKKVWGICR